MALTFGTLLSSQGADALILRPFGLRSRRYLDCTPRSAAVEPRGFVRRLTRLAARSVLARCRGNSTRPRGAPAGGSGRGPSPGATACRWGADVRRSRLLGRSPADFGSTPSAPSRSPPHRRGLGGRAPRAGGCAPSGSPAAASTRVGALSHPSQATPRGRNCTLTRGPTGFAVFGMPCSHVRWQEPPMTTRSP